MGVVYLAYCGSWQLSLHVPCFCAFYIFNTTPNPTSSSFFQNVFVLVLLYVGYRWYKINADESPVSYKNLCNIMRHTITTTDL